MTLIEAWEKRKPMWASGSKMIEEGNALWKEISALPGAVRVGIWYSFSEMGKEAAEKVFHGYALRAEADAIWHDAIVEQKGQKAKMTWAYNAEKKGYDCTLEDGQEFKA